MTTPERPLQWLDFKRKHILYACLAWISCAAFPLYGADFNWQGAGTGPQTGNLWDTSANWNVTGIPDGPLPGANDTVNVALAIASASDDAVVISDGAAGGNVKFSGGNNTDNRQVLVDGNATFGSLAIDFGVGVQQQDIFNLNGKKITITGGTALIPSLKTGAFNAARIPFSGTGEIEFTASNVYLSIGARNPYDLRFTTAGATIDFLNVAPHLEGSLGVRSDQTFANVTTIFLEGASIISLDSQRLDNLSGIFLESYRPGAGQDNTGHIAAGTYGGMVMNSDSTGLSYNSFTLAGDVSLDGKTNIDGINYTVLIDRRNRNQAIGELVTDGYDLATTGDGTGTFRVGSLAPDTATTVSRLDLTSGGGGHSTVSVQGDFVVGYNGYILAPDAADLIVEGDFESRSVKNTLFNGSGLVLRMEGNGDAGNPQFLELPGEDLGPQSPGAPPANNFFIGSLIIGTVDDPTYVSLTDNFEFSLNGDALYVGSLFVNDGSTLALQGFHLYVDGVLVLPGDTQYGGGWIVVPEPGMVGLLFAAGFMVFLIRFRKQEPLAP